MLNLEFLKILLFVFCSVIILKVQATKNESRLIQHLLKDYDILSRPVDEEDTPLVLKIRFTLLQLIDVNEKQQIITTNLWLSLSWSDVNLIWEPNEFGNISSVRIPRDRLWTPDIEQYNTASELEARVADVKALVFNNGSAIYVPPLILKSTCKMDVTWFPFDVQKCEIIFGSWTYSGLQIDMQLLNNENGSAVDLDTYLDNGEWLLLGVETTRHVTYYPCCTEPYVTVGITIHIKRRSLYYFFNLIVPCALIGFLALLGFTLPPDSGEKLSLGVTVLFSLIVFLNMISGSMPANSDAVPLLGTYFNCVMFMIASSVVSTIIINLNLRSSRMREINGRPKKLFFYWLPWILRLHPPFALDEKHSAKPNLIHAMEKGSNPKEVATTVKSQDTESHERSNLLDLNQKVAEERIKLQWKFVALVVDRICFLISIAFAIMATIVLLVSAL